MKYLGGKELVKHREKESKKQIRLKNAEAWRIDGIGNLKPPNSDTGTFAQVKIRCSISVRTRVVRTTTANLHADSL